MTDQHKSCYLNRRHVLRGMGVTLALPFLDCMKAVGAAATNPRPKRSAFFYLPNGVNTLDYQILESGKDYAFSKSLKPLEKHRQIITPISGLHHPNGLGHHHNCDQIWLTGGPIGQSVRNTISVDQLMMQTTAPHTRFASMQLSGEGDCLAWNGDGIRLPSQRSPGVMFREMFEEPKGGVAQQRRGLNRRGSILDAVIGEARDLDRKLGQEDKGRLEQYLTSVREVEVRTERADAWLDVPRPKIDPKDKARVNRSVSKEKVGEYFRTMYDLIVLAFQTDMTRVATFTTGVEGKGLKIPEIGIMQDRHSLSHHNGNPKLLKDLTGSDIFNIQQFAYFLDRLSEVEDANGPLIDTTMALYGSGMSFGHSHGNANVPLVLAGGAGLGLKHGSHLDYNTQSKDFKGYTLDKPSEHYRLCHRPANTKGHLSNLLLTMAQKMDVKTDTFADSNGVISEVLT